MDSYLKQNKRKGDETKTVVSITELTKMGYPRESIKRAVNSRYGSMFARRTTPRGKWFINLQKFEEYWNRGDHRKDGRMTQCEQVLEYMKQKGGITAWDAVYNLGVFRLSARISDLKADGYKIKTETVRKKDGRGEFKNYARYSLDE